MARSAMRASVGPPLSASAARTTSRQRCSSRRRRMTSRATRLVARDRSTLCRWARARLIRAVRIQTRHYTDERTRKTQRAHWYVSQAELERFLALYRSGALS